MIRVVMFDLGMTLVDGERHPFPHVTDALTAIADFKTGDGKPLRSCLVSDFTMPTKPVTDAKVTALFEEYLAILDQTGLRRFFEPVKEPGCRRGLCWNSALRDLQQLEAI